MKKLAALVALALLASLTSVATATGAPAKPKPPVGDAFPYCSWWTVTTPETMNVAFPDTSAIYWTTPYLAQPGMSIEVSGTFPETRFMAFTAYSNTFGTFQSADGVPSQITDYQIVANPGTPEPNPWAQDSAPGTPPGGTFSVTLSPNATTGQTNTIPILPPGQTANGELPANLGFLVMRVYLAKGGQPSDVALPTLTLVDSQGARVTLPKCSDKSMAAIKKLKDAAKVLALLKAIASGKQPPPPPPCSTAPTGCPPEYSFFRASAAQTNSFFPNDANAYASMLFTPVKGEVVVIRLKPPTSPWNVDGGTTPVPWPTTDYQMRYWSVCNNVYAPPYPVVANPGRKGQTVYGCVADNAAVRDSDGIVTIVISATVDRPRNATAANGFNWLPTSMSKPRAMEMVALRNMLPSAGFNNAVQNVPSGSDAAATQAAMGLYYPDTAVCTVPQFEAGDLTKCFIPAASGT